MTMWTLSINGTIPRFDDGWPKYTWYSLELAEQFVTRVLDYIEVPSATYRIVPHPGRQ